MGVSWAFLTSGDHRDLPVDNVCVCLSICFCVCHLVVREGFLKYTIYSLRVFSSIDSENRFRFYKPISPLHPEGFK